MGYDDTGRLCEFVRRNPYCVLLFDEIEKAHPDIFNLLLQILDDATLTDAHSRRVDFSETIIVMTSNIGARGIQTGASLGFAGGASHRKDIAKEKIMDELKRYFNPEFLNRIDEVITFQTLKLEDLRKVIEIMIDQINKHIFTKKIHLQLDKKAIDWIAYSGYSEKQGARPLRRVLQKEIEDYLAVCVLEGQTKEASEFLISASGACTSQKEAKELKLIFTQRPWAGYKDMRTKQEQDLKKREERIKKSKSKKEEPSLPARQLS